MRCYWDVTILYSALWYVLAQQAAHAVEGNGGEHYSGHPGYVPFNARRDSSAQVVDIPFQTQDLESRRQLYTINCSIGTPHQTVTLVLRAEYGDTDLEEDIEWEAPITYYQPSASSTYRGHILSAGWNTSEGGTADGEITGYNLTYASDDFEIAGITFEDMPFISASNRTSSGTLDPGYALFYRLGLGLPPSEAAIWSDSSGTGDPYPTFLQRILAKGLIMSTTYSIWLGPEGSLSGHLLLGGLNTKRYQGVLTNLRTSTTTSTNVLEIGYLTQLTVTVSSVSITTTAGTNSTTTKLKLPAQIDGLALIQYPGTVLPASAAVAIWDALGASYDKSADPGSVVPIVPCSYMTNTSTLNFEFVSDIQPNFIWPIPLSDIVVHNGSLPSFSSGPYAAACRVNIGVLPDGQDFAALSPQMMRSLYTVYDLSNNVISVAVTDFNATEDNLVAIPTGGVAAIPSTILGSVATQPATSGSASAPALSSPKVGGAADEGHELALRLGIGIGLGVPVLLMCGGLCIWYNKRRKRNTSAAPIQEDMISSGELSGEGATRSHFVNELHTEDQMQEHNELHRDGNIRRELSGDEPMRHYEMATNTPLAGLANF